MRKMKIDICKRKNQTEKIKERKKKEYVKIRTGE